MSSPVEQLLQTWREAERVLDTLPPLTPDHENVARAVVRLRDCYQALTDQRGRGEDSVAEAQRAVDESVALIDRVLNKGQQIDP